MYLLLQVLNNKPGTCSLLAKLVNMTYKPIPPLDYLVELARCKKRMKLSHL